MRANRMGQTNPQLLAVVVVVGIATIVLLRTASPATFTSAGSSIAPTGSASTAAPIDTNPVQAPNLDSLPPDTRAQFDALPRGTILVACNSSVSHFPDGIIPETAVGWTMAHPGWQVLVHGYCVDNPDAIRTFEPQQIP
jgi:hypothetical protein